MASLLIYLFEPIKNNYLTLVDGLNVTIKDRRVKEV